MMSMTPIVSMQLAEIAEVVGVPAALRLADAFGGQEGCNVPKTPRRDHPWVEPLGWEPFAALCEAYGGCRITIPRNAFAKTIKSKMAELKRQGYSHRAIARRLKCTERYVRMVMNGGQDDRQACLFADD